MNLFSKAMESVGTEKRTLNDAKTYSSSLSKCLDLFALGGSIRSWSDDDIKDMFNEAYKENPIIATKIALYVRDIRNGMGERKIGRIFLSLLANKYNYNNDEMIFKVLPHISEIGRWDDIVYVFYEAKNDSLKKFIATIISATLKEDIVSKKPSLLAKWLPSINAGKLSRRKAIELLKYLELPIKEYRKTLSSIRKKIDIVETKITEQRFKEIDYSKIPSQAMLRYNKTFYNKDEDRFLKYIEDVKKGDKKINTKTIYPYQIIKKPLVVKFKGGYSQEDENFYNTAWENLPDYTNGSKAIVMADTSGSMLLPNIEPLSIALSLAIYFAERNEGPFKDKFMTFSHTPVFQLLRGETLHRKVMNLDTTGWSQNTDINKAFRLVLETGIKFNVPQKDMPEAIYIISDMEFDRATNSSENFFYKRNNITIEKTNFELIRKMYNEAGYEVPTLVFWNVNAISRTIPVRFDENGTVLISGRSPTVFSLALNRSSPEEFMMKTLLNRYEFVE